MNDGKSGGLSSQKKKEKSKQTVEIIDFYLSGSRLSLLWSGRNDNFEGTRRRARFMCSLYGGSEGQYNRRRNKCGGHHPSLFLEWGSTAEYI